MFTDNLLEAIGAADSNGNGTIEVPELATYVHARLVVAPVSEGPRVRKLDPKTPLALVRGEAGWTLVASEGRPVGYVATRDPVAVAVTALREGRRPSQSPANPLTPHP